jgi:hypothetical protein
MEDGTKMEIREVESREWTGLNWLTLVNAIKNIRVL